MRRSLGLLLAIVMALSACADAPEPGDLAAFCEHLSEGVGLASTSTSIEFELLAEDAPPDIRPTVVTLANQARDFDELMTMNPPDLEALFEARFTPERERERAALDRYAENNCGVVVDRPPSTRWNDYLVENHANADWRDAPVNFDRNGERIDAATAVFDTAPARTEMVEEICQALSDFLNADGNGESEVRVVIETRRVLSYPNADGVCQLP